MKKLIFCDIDGTIVDGSRGMNEVSQKTTYAIEELKKDNYVVIASGRCRGLLDEKIKALHPSGYVLCNGAYAQILGKEIHAMYFQKSALDRIRTIVKRYDGFYIFETLDEMYVDSFASSSFRYFLQGWGKILDGFKEEKEDQDDKYLIAMIGFKNRNDLKKAKEELEGFVDLADHKMFSSCDVNIHGVNKATGVKKIIEYLNVPKEDTYCFGDGINDLEMLQCVGHPVIMANCMNELRSYGFEQTGDVLDDGFYSYLAINKLIKAI